MNMSSLLLTMIALPLAGAALNGLVLRTPRTKRAGTVATLFSATSFVIAVILWAGLLRTHEPVSVRWSWFVAGSVNVSWGFLFDSLTASMALVVTGIGTLIH